jgi:hypothetical protein
MAPEQAKGEESGPPADFWALGATMFYAVEGEPPFDRGTSIATLAAVVNDPPRPPRRAGALAPLITALLSKDPGSRPSGAELRAELGRLAGPRPSPPTEVLPVHGPGRTVPLPAAAQPDPTPVPEAAPDTTDPSSEEAVDNREHPSPPSATLPHRGTQQPGVGFPAAPPAAAAASPAAAGPAVPDAGPDAEASSVPEAGAPEVTDGGTPASPEAGAEAEAARAQTGTPEVQAGAPEVQTGAAGVQAGAAGAAGAGAAGLQPVPAEAQPVPDAQLAPEAQAAPTSTPGPPPRAPEGQPTPTPSSRPPEARGVPAPAPRPPEVSAFEPALPDPDSDREPARPLLPPAPAVDRGGRGRMVGVLALLVVLGLVAVLIAVNLRSGGDGDPTAAPATTAAGGGGNQASETTRQATSTTEAPSTTGAPTTTAAGAGLPEGWTSFTNRRGANRVGVPPDFRARTRQSYNATVVEEQGGADRVFTVRSTNPANPLPQASREYRAYAAREFEDFREVRYEENQTYAGRPGAVVFEYEAVRDGRRVHVSHVNLKGRTWGYNVELIAPADQWGASQGLAGQFEQAFQPLG